VVVLDRLDLTRLPIQRPRNCKITRRGAYAEDEGVDSVVIPTSTKSRRGKKKSPQKKGGRSKRTVTTSVQEKPAGFIQQQEQLALVSPVAVKKCIRKTPAMFPKEVTSGCKLCGKIKIGLGIITHMMLLICSNLVVRN